MSSLSIVIPTHDRREELNRTLEAIGAYPKGNFGSAAEVIVVDNASRVPVREHLVTRLENGIRVEVVGHDENIATAGRNLGVERASGDWIVMLDDDSAPIWGDIGRVLESQPEDVAGVGGEILLLNGTRESGGLPEVFVGCGCAIRREVYLDVGGYDASFGYYAEEYDLCAKMIQAGHRIVHTQALGFEHRKVVQGRDFGEILFRLVRNSAWVIARYAPTIVRQNVLDAMIDRYQRIAVIEGAEEGMERAIEAIESTLDGQRESPMDMNHWRRFSGAHAVSEGLVSRFHDRGIDRVGIVAAGKGDDIIKQELAAGGIELDQNASERVIGALVIGTLSPGPMLDAALEYPEAMPAWSLLPR